MPESLTVGTDEVDVVDDAVPDDFAAALIEVDSLGADEVAEQGEDGDKGSFVFCVGMYIVPYSPPGGGGVKSFGKIFKLYRWEKKKIGRERRKSDEKTKREKKKGRKREKRG